MVIIPELVLLEKKLFDKKKTIIFFKLDLISLIYNSDDAKKGHPNIIKSCLIKEM